MQIFNYLKGLFHRITRGQIKSSCDLTIESIQTHTLPAYAQANELFKLRRISSKEGIALAGEFKKRVGTVKGTTGMVDAIEAILENTVKMLGTIVTRSDAVFSDIESTLGMTYQKAMYLRLISAATFANDFSRKFLNYLYVLETANLEASENHISDALSPAEISYVKDNFANYVLVMTILSNSFVDVLKSIDELPDAVVSEQSDQVLSGSLGAKKVDPFGFRNLSLPITVGVNLNPFYLAGMLIADFRASQYKCSKEELDLLALRKLNLERLYAKKPDARLQQQIDYLGDRVSRLNYELATMKEKYA